jgi:uncharacterized repeat protein (TIGR01451 family)
MRSAASGLCLSIFLALITPANALAAPVAGSVIGNQASATYVDGAGQTRTATSNLVETIIAQVAGVDIQADQSKTVSAGGTVYYPHTITNTGNGADTFDLTAADADSGNIVFGSVVVYADVNQDGVPDNFTPITVTPGMNPGESYGIVVAATVPGTVSATDSETVTVSAASQFDAGSTTDSNTDTVTVTGNAILDVTKAIDLSSGPSPNGNPGDADNPITVTLTYTNRGIGTATAVTITDALPAGMAYVAGSGSWSGSAAGLGDLAGGTDDPAGITYDGGDTTTNEIVAVIASVPQGQSGTISFEVTINASLSPGTLDNVAQYSYNDGAAVVGPTDTNTASYTVLPVSGVSLSDDNSNTDDDGATTADVLISGPVAQGSMLVFDNVLVNTGNGTDIFDVDLSGSNFPAGTTFQLFQGDASGNPVAPMTDSNGNGIPDTGPLAAGATYHVVLKATLPTNQSGGPFSVTKTATSQNDPSQTASVTDTLTAVQALSVDLTNNTAGAGAPGDGVGPEDLAVTTNSVDPGATTVFTLLIENESTLSGDTYNLDASTDGSFTTVSLPAGWSVVFRNAGGSAITSIAVAAASTETVTAEVTVPANSAPVVTPGQSVYFRVASSTSGAIDIKHDAVIVNTVHDLAIAASSTGQVFPSGIIEYPFTLTNDGNVAESAATLAAVNSNTLWVSAPLIYHDANGNGVIDAGEPVVTDLSAVITNGGAAGGATANLDPGENVNLIARVEAPAGANAGDTNSTTVTVGDPGGDADLSNNTLADITTVISGDVTLAKEQGLDSNCDGDLADAGDVAYTTGQISSATVVPGSCVLYRVTATNTGSTAVSSLVMTDVTPSFTTYGCDSASPQVVNNCAASATSGTVTEPALGASGVVSVDVGPLAPAAVSVLTFGVKINP